MQNINGKYIVSTLDAYQSFNVSRNKKYPDMKQALQDGALGLNGEAGEVADIVKKHVYHGHDLDKQHLIEELGDTLWYISIIAASVGVSLSDVATQNVEKLVRRYPEGFTIEQSINREDK